MFDTVEKLKEFLLWAKQHKITTVKIGENAFEFSQLSMLDDGITKATAKPEQASNQTWADTEPTTDVEDPDLYWSSNLKPAAE